MSNNYGKTHKKRNLLIATIGLVMMLCMALVISNVFIKRDVPVSVAPQGQNTLNTDALLNENGWNADVLRELNDGIKNFNNNEAFENVSIIKLGNIEWLVTFKQGNIVTLLATKSVGEASNVSDANEYLENVFYPEFKAMIGYQKLDDYIVVAGDSDIAYQQSNVQNIPLLSVNNDIVVTKDVNSGQKVWLPSAYEIGGNITRVIGTEAVNQSERVNSFKSVEKDNLSINTGLWNIAEDYRTESLGMWLRSTGKYSANVYLDNNGILNTIGTNSTKSIVPAIHLMLPVVDAMGNVIESTKSGDINSGAKLAFSNTSSMTGAGTQASPYQVNDAQDLVCISSQVASGNNCSGLYFQMQNDIDMSNITIWTPIGKYVGVGNANNKAFYGVFDGNGYVIRNLSEFTTGLPGVFGYISSSAVVKGLGVEDSNWTTSASYAGAIVGYMDGSSKVEECYNACGISGNEYIGGIVGVSISSNAITNCYNLAGVAGKNYVGGIVGKATSVNKVYNIGSTYASNGTSVGGIVGQSDTVQNSFYSNSTNNGKGTYQENFVNMYGVSTTLYLNAGWDFDNVWKISRAINNQFPILRKFVHNAEIKIVTNIENAGTYKITKSTTNYTDVDALREGIIFDLGTILTISATANAGYRFVGWYHYTTGIDGSPVFSDDELSKQASYSLGAVYDSYFLEARFMNVYNIVVEDNFIGFDSYTGVAYAVSVNNNNSGTSNVYDEGSVLTITVDTTLNNLDFDKLIYKSSATGAYSETEISTLWVSKVVNANNIVYTLNINEDNGIFASYKTLYLQLQFTRVFNLSVALNVTSPVDKYLPTAQAVWGPDENQTIITATANGVGQSNTIRFDTNFYIIQNMSAVSESRVFAGWTVDIEGTVKDLTSSAGRTTIDFDATNFAGVFNFVDTDYDITVIANYTMQKYTLAVTNMFGDTRDSNDGNNNSALATMMIALEGETIQLLDTATGGAVTREIEYGRKVTVAFLPKYENGYTLTDVYSVDEKDNTTAYPYTEPAAGANYYKFEIASFSGNTQFTVKYGYLPISFDVSAKIWMTDKTSGNLELKDLSDKDYLGVKYTVTGAKSDVNYYTTISKTSSQDGVQLILSAENKKNFGFSQLLVNIGGTDYPVTCNLTQANYNQTNYVVFSNLFKILDIYNSAGVVLTPDNTTFSIKIVMQTMSRNLIIVNYYEGTTTSVPESDAATTASAASDVTIVAGSQYVDGAEITVTTSALNVGHQFMGFKTATTDTSYKGIVNNAGNYNNSGTYTFVIRENTTVIAYYKKRTYNVQINSNVWELNSSLSNYTMQDLGMIVKFAGTPKDLNSIKTQTIVGAYGDNVNFEFTRSQVINTANGDLTVKLQKIEVYYDNDVLPYDEYIREDIDAYMFDLKDDVETIKVNFVFRLIREVTITLNQNNDTTTMANGTLLKLKSKTTNEATFVVLRNGLDGVTVDMPEDDYVIEFFLPIFCQAFVDGSKLTGTNPETKYELQVVGASTEINVNQVEKTLNEAVTNSFVIL